MTGQTVPAAMPRRATAAVIDAVVWLALGGELVVLAVLAELDAGPLATASPGRILSLLAVGCALTLAVAAFQAWYEGTRGFSIGKRAAGVRTVAAATLEPLGIARTLLRTLILVAGVLTAGLGLVALYLSTRLDPSGWRRGWHDQAVDAIVVAAVPALASPLVSMPVAPVAAAPIAAPIAAVAAPVAAPVAARASTWAAVPTPSGPPPSEPLAASVISAVPFARLDAAPVVVGEGAQASRVMDRAAVPPVPAQSSELDGDVELTRMSSARDDSPDQRAATKAPPARSATLELWDGRRLRLVGTALIGRNPTARPGERVPEQLISVADPKRSVSKTQLAIGLDARGVWLRDRTSTNGTVVTLADGQIILCAPEHLVRVPTGTTVAFGDFWLVVAD